MWSAPLPLPPATTRPPAVRLHVHTCSVSIAHTCTHAHADGRQPPARGPRGAARQKQGVARGGAAGARGRAPVRRHALAVCGQPALCHAGGCARARLAAPARALGGPPGWQRAPRGAAACTAAGGLGCQEHRAQQRRVASRARCACCCRCCWPQDEELIQFFTCPEALEGCPELSPDAHGGACALEGVRIVRDAQTSLGKGFGFVLFRTKVGGCVCTSAKWALRLCCFAPRWVGVCVLKPSGLWLVLFRTKMGRCVCLS